MELGNEMVLSKPGGASKTLSGQVQLNLGL